MQDGWPFGAIDLFHLSMHQELRAQRLGPNVCAMVAEVAGRLPMARVRERLVRAVRELPELGWRAARGHRFERVWKEGGPGMALSERGIEGPLLEAVVDSLDEPAHSRAPWRLQVLHGPEHDALALTWFHAATDARGATRLLSWIGDEGADVPEKRFMTGDRLLAKLSGVQRRELTQAYVAHVFELGRHPIVSLQRAAGRRRPGRQRAIRMRLSQAETRSFYESLRQRAGLADTSLMLWATGRLLDRMMCDRGLCPPRQLVPVPLSLDPKKGSRRMFGNHLTMMMLALDREDLLEERVAVAHLAKQRRHVVRHKLDVGMLCAIRASRHVPRRFVDYLSKRPFSGERSSFILSNPGAIELGQLFGCEVRDAFAVPTLLPAPGFQVTVDGFEGQLSLMIMYREGYASHDELRRHLPAFKRDLLP